MKTKYCGGCKQDLSLDNFAKNSSRKDGVQTRCRACKKKHDADYYKRNKQYYLDYNKKQYKKRFQDVSDYKQQHGCKNCDENNPCCLDFHHPDNNKDENVARLMTNGSNKRLWNEIAKCVVVCSNCHRKIHAGSLVLR